MLKALSPRQFTEWGEFYRLEPFGFDVEDARMAIVCATTARSMGSKTAKPADFMMGERYETEMPETMFVDVLKSVLGAKEVSNGETVIADR